MLLSGFNEDKAVCIQRIKSIDDFEGNPSFQNALELAMQQFELETQPLMRKEVLLINSSVSICDPGNIADTISRLKTLSITSSVISLSAQLHVLAQLVSQTKGQFSLATSEAHFLELIQKFIVPQQTQLELTTSAPPTASHKIKVVFPQIKYNPTKKLCHLHNHFIF